MLLTLFFLIFAKFYGNAESQEVYGSRIVTTSTGPVGPLNFRMLQSPEGKINYKEGKVKKFTIDSNDNCVVGISKVGRPCNFDTTHLTTDNNILISNVTIRLNKGVESYVTYKWGTDVSSVAITLDWKNSGVPSEVNECQGKNS
ncbi:unnamed protein product [Rodentolepis nana]|uniref:DUF5727 domain-containing protein n=1 Tax=Rodentolepis nana TaxID=102285 RepID=A0A158QIK4_RODNA|nr:unnamed protein product [Rodentolepis nana]